MSKVCPHGHGMHVPLGGMHVLLGGVHDPLGGMHAPKKVKVKLVCHRRSDICPSGMSASPHQ